MTAHMAPTPVHLGVANNGNQTEFAMSISSGIASLCLTLSPNQGHTNCSDGTASIDQMTTVTDYDRDEGWLEFTIDGSNYTTNEFRELTLAMAVASFEQSSANNCKQVEYEHTIAESGHDCSDPGMTDLAIGSSDQPFQAEKPLHCSANMTVCNGPNNVCKFSVLHLVSFMGSSAFELPLTWMLVIGIDVQLVDTNGNLHNYLVLHAEFKLDSDPAWLASTCEIIESLLEMVELLSPKSTAEIASAEEGLQAVCDIYD